MTFPKLFCLALCALLLPAVPAEAKKKDRPLDPAPSAMDDNPQALLQLGSKYLQDGLLPQARETLQKAIRLAPGGYAEAEYLLGVVCTLQRDHDCAIRSLEGALKTNPFFTEAHNALGMAYSDMGQKDRALLEFRIVLSDQQYPTPEVPNFNIGRIYLETGRTETALTYFKRACDLSPKFGRACFQQGLTLEKLGRLREAREALEKGCGNIPETNPEAPQCHLRLGLICYDLKDTGCARTHLLRSLELAPTPEDDRRARELLDRLGEAPGVRVVPGGAR